MHIQRLEYPKSPTMKNGCFPFVKWAGGKGQLLRHLEKEIPKDFTRYIEPFLGGGALFFHLVSKKESKFSALLSDSNCELINAYNVVKNTPDDLIPILKQYQIKYDKNPSDFYYRLRAKSNLNSRIAQAARFIALNRTCYNGLYRVNSKGLFNVPIGSYVRPVICNTKNLRAASIALKSANAKIRTCDYYEILNIAEKNDFVYLDPPYSPVSSTANFVSYTKNGFGDRDQKNLARFFKKLDRQGCKILLNNSDTPAIRSLYEEYREYTKEVDVRRSINCKGSRRRGHKELIIKNYAQERLRKK